MLKERKEYNFSSFAPFVFFAVNSYATVISSFR